jgi:type IV pilus assembly PilX-like protein
MSMEPLVRNKNRREKGVALIITLFLMLAMSVIASSLMFLSQTETYASQNYRVMSQARYGAESGVHRAANYLMYSYAPPTSAGDLALYDLTKSPVRYNASDVLLSSTSPGSGNYPDAAVKAAFNTATTNSLAAGITTVGYTASAKLLSMRQINEYAKATPTTIQTWLITSVGTIASGSRTAQVEVSAVLERGVGPAFSYAAFAIYNGCDALDWAGGGNTYSYDSTALGGGTPPNDQYGGNIGSNGNLTSTGTPTYIYGSLSTPRTGVGACSTNNVTSWTSSGSPPPTGGTVTLPQSLPFTTPDPPNPLPPTTTMDLNSNCNDTSYSSPQCTVSGGNVTLTPSGATLSLGNVTLNGNSTLHLKAGTYNINSLKFTGNSKIVVDSGPVYLNVAGLDGSGGYLATPIDFEGQMASNMTGIGNTAGYDPTMIQIRYAGTGEIKGAGGADNAALVYAPKATFNLTGGSDWYGAVIANKVTVSGNNTAIHYDRHLRKSELLAGAFMMSSFTWKKY